MAPSTRFGREQGLGEERVWADSGDGGEGLWIGTPHDGLYHLQGEIVSRSPEMPSAHLDGVNTLVAAFPGATGLGPAWRKTPSCSVPPSEGSEDQIAADRQTEGRPVQGAYHLFPSGRQVAL